MDRYTSGAMVAIGRIIALALLLLGGCSSGQKWVGNWHGLMPETTAVHENPAIEATLRSVELTISADATFELTIYGVPFTGEADLGSDSARLRVIQVLGRKAERASGEILGIREFQLERLASGEVRLTATTEFLPDVILSRRKPD